MFARAVLRLVPLLLLVGVLACEREPSVLVVGLDGADWDVMDPLMEGGHLPTIGALVRSGARADLDCEPAWPEFSCFCPPVWVSIATGQPAAVHGIYKLGDPSTQRRVKAIWQVLGESGGASILDSYRNTDPPDAEAAYVFTESGNALAGAVNFRTWTSPLPPVDPTPLAQPENLYESLGLLPYTEERLDAHAIFAKDRVAMEGFTRLSVLTTLLAPFFPRPRLNVILLHSPDKSQHVAWGTIQHEPGGPIDDDRVRELAASWRGPVFGPKPFALGNSVSQYLEAEQWLTRLLEWARYDYVVLVSDHGMDRNPGTGLAGIHGPAVPEAHDGVFSITGPGIVPGTVIEDASVLDVAPTLAYALDLPIANDLAGRMLSEAFSRKWLQRHPPRRVPKW